jgi:hypothetical protein
MKNDRQIAVRCKWCNVDFTLLFANCSHVRNGCRWMVQARRLDMQRSALSERQHELEQRETASERHQRALAVSMVESLLLNEL